MNRSFKQSLVLMSLVAVFAAPSAFASVSLSLFGAGVLPQSVDDTTTLPGSTITAKGKFGFGGGAALEWRFHRMVGLEVAGIYLQRKVGVELDTVDTGLEVSQKSVYIPLGVLVHFNRYLSLQGGGFYDVSTESGGEANYGLQGGLRITIPLGQKADFLVDGRYNLGLKDFDGYKHSDLVLALAGFSFHFGSTK